MDCQSTRIAQLQGVARSTDALYGTLYRDSRSRSRTPVAVEQAGQPARTGIAVHEGGSAVTRSPRHRAIAWPALPCRPAALACVLDAGDGDTALLVVAHRARVRWQASDRRRRRPRGLPGYLVVTR
jgi:hypothetical protein